MYRPTVRYSEVYRTYVDAWFHASVLDRNQIIRCALFTAAHNPHFLKLMNQYKKSDVTPPSPLWSQSNNQVWLDQDIEVEKIEEVITHDINTRKGTSSSTTQVSRTSSTSGSIRKTNISPKSYPSSSKKKEEQYRRQQPSEGRTRSLPSLQLNNNGGIRLDLR